MSFLKDFGAGVQQWNKEEFGHIFWKKQNCLKRLSSIQRAFQQGPSNFLANLEQEITKGYSKLLRYEELFWHQKSKEKQFMEVERNTRAFHISTLIKKQKKLVCALKDSGDN